MTRYTIKVLLFSISVLFMLCLQSSTKNSMLFLCVLTAVVLIMGACGTTAHAAPLFDEPVSYEISAFDDLGEEDWGGQVLDSVVADFNADGFPDIAATYQDGGTPSADYNTPAGIEGVVILMNNGDGTFIISSYISYGENLVAIVSEDFDNDGDFDLATVNGNDLTVLLNDGIGGFTIASQSLAIGAEKVVSADFDGDGSMDLAATLIEDVNAAGIQIFLNNGSGDFALSSLIHTYTSGYTAVADLTPADFDGDGDVDIVAGSRNGIGILSVISNDGNGVFENSEVTLYTEEAGNAPEFYEMSSSDVDDDGDIDVVATINGTQLISLLTLINDGDGSFTLGQTFYSSNPGPVTVSDFDNDGDVDIVTPNYNYEGNWIHYLTNDGSGFFTPVEDSISVPNLIATSINSVDVNNDSKADLVISTSELGVLTTLQLVSENPTPTEQAAALVADVIGLDLPNNIENSYLANLYKVEGFIGSAQITPAINQLNAFINKLNNDYRQGKISEADHDNLVLAAQQLISDLLSL